MFRYILGFSGEIRGGECSLLLRKKWERRCGFLLLSLAAAGDESVKKRLISEPSGIKLILLLTNSGVSKTLPQNEVVCFCLATNLCVRPWLISKYLV